jgi:hypothetical protein
LRSHLPHSDRSLILLAQGSLTLLTRGRAYLTAGLFTHSSAHLTSPYLTAGLFTHAPLTSLTSPPNSPHLIADRTEAPLTPDQLRATEAASHRRPCRYLAPAHFTLPLRHSPLAQYIHLPRALPHSSGRPSPTQPSDPTAPPRGFVFWNAAEVLRYSIPIFLTYFFCCTNFVTTAAGTIIRRQRLRPSHC